MNVHKRNYIKSTFKLNIAGHPQTTLTRRGRGR